MSEMNIHHQNKSISPISDKEAIPLDMDGMVSKYTMELVRKYLEQHFGKLNRRHRRKL